MVETQVNETAPKVVVVQLSEAFGDVWGWVADELGDSAVVVQSQNGMPPMSDVAIVLLSAGAAERTALEWLDSHSLPSGVPAIVVGIDYGRRLPAQAVKAGAADYFALPDDLPLVRSAVTAAVERCRGANGGRHAGDPPDKPFASVIAESDVMQQALERAAWLIKYASVPVLVVGEPGTGKGLIARAVHDASERRQSPFVPVECGSVPESVHLDLFGQAEDSVGGGATARPGLLEVAEGGTVFVHDVHTMPIETQLELARVIRTNVLRRVGGTKEYSINVRVITSCREDPERLVERGELHRALYSEMGVVTLRLPALRERDDDVLLIARALVTRIAREHGLPEPSLSSEVERFLRDHSWPGNVRELKTVLVRALLLSPPGDLSLSQLRAAVDVASAGESQPLMTEARS
jgi:DNA-binding NtrC family response regulator